MSAHKKPLSTFLIFTVWWKSKVRYFSTTCKATFSNKCRLMRKSTRQHHKHRKLCDGMTMYLSFSGASLVFKNKQTNQANHYQSHLTTIWRKAWLTAAPLLHSPPPSLPAIPTGNFSPKSISMQKRQQLIFQNCYFRVCLWVLRSSLSDLLLLATCWLDKRDKYLVS